MNLLDVGLIKSISSRDTFKDYFIELQSSIENWMNKITGTLLNHSNWNWKQLTKEDGSTRKPRIELRTYITKPGNLVLEWQPIFTQSDMDFIRFSDIPYGWETPPNRIVMLREFDHLYYFDDTPERIKVINMLLNETTSHLSNIERFLSKYFEITIESRLHTFYSVPFALRNERELIKLRIIDKKEYEEIVEKERNQFKEEQKQKRLLTKQNKLTILET